MVNPTAMGAAVLNKGKSFMNPEFIKEQSLILASLALVISRIVVANVSAMQARGTADGPFRYRESIRTDMREIGGFTMGFLVLRAFQWGIKKGLRAGLNIKEPADSGYNYKLFENLGKAWKGESVDKFQADYAREAKVLFKEQGNFGKLGKLMQKIPNLVPGDLKKAETFFSKVYRHAPIIIGSVPTVFLAGYMLERMTRDHSEVIVDAVSKRLGGGSHDHPPSVPPISQPAVGAGVSPVPMMPQFGANRYMNPYRVTPNLFATQRI